MKAPNILVPALGVLIAVFVGGVVFLFMGPVRYHPAYFFTLLNAPEEVKDMTFVLAEDNSSSLVSIRRGGLEVQKFPNQTILQVARTTDTTLVSVVQKGSGATDIVKIKGATQTPLSTDGKAKGSVAISPSGTYIAYAVLSRPNTSTFESPEDDVAAYAYTPDDYSVELYDNAGVLLKTFTGNHPHFFDENTLVFFSSRGIETFNIATDDVTFTSDDLALLTKERPYIGANGVVMVTNDITNELLVFEYVSEAPPIVYQLVAVIPHPPRSFVLTRDTAVYQGVFSEDRFIIKKFTDFEQEPETIFSIPSALLAPSFAIF